MTMAIRVLIVLIAAALSAMPAKAATTIYASSVFSSSSTLNPGQALSLPNSAAALVQPLGDIVLQYANPLTGAGISAYVLPTAGFNVLALSIGEVISGVATFSGEFVLVDAGLGGALSADLTSHCATVSLSGCSLLRIRNAGSLLGSTGIQLDAVSAVTTAPEPAAWALMIVGFLATALRLKSVRGEQGRLRRLDGLFRFRRTLAA
ncbi:MAG: hypothetical protein HXY23_01345 [Parvularculaceae bacterium]|nr:hypothetical protein [Parvularculaceae bacterium]